MDILFQKQHIKLLEEVEQNAVALYQRLAELLFDEAAGPGTN